LKKTVREILAQSQRDTSEGKKKKRGAKKGLGGLGTTKVVSKEGGRAGNLLGGSFHFPKNWFPGGGGTWTGQGGKLGGESGRAEAEKALGGNERRFREGQGKGPARKTARKGGAGFRKSPGKRSGEQAPQGGQMEKGTPKRIGFWKERRLTEKTGLVRSGTGCL